MTTTIQLTTGVRKGTVTLEDAAVITTSGSVIDISRGPDDPSRGSDDMISVSVSDMTITEPATSKEIKVDTSC